MRELSLFISHSASDAQLAKALTYLFEKALKIPVRQIRCTSVDGYRLPVGTDTDEQLRREVFDARALVGVITPAAVQSPYVMFELGARWGARRHLAPVLGRGADASYLGGPLSGMSALRLGERNEVVQLLEDIAEHLEMILEPSASYQEAIEVVVATAKVPADPRSDPKKEVLDLVSQAVASINVNAVQASPRTAYLGTHVLIEFDITSTLSTSLEVWLGADIQYAPDQYFYDITEDKVVAIDPGRHTYYRNLTLATPLVAGSWIINAGVWLGRISDPDHSIRLVLRGVDITIG